MPDAGHRTDDADRPDVAIRLTGVTKEFDGPADHRAGLQGARRRSGSLLGAEHRPDHLGWNTRTDIEFRESDEVATEWLESKGLLQPVTPGV